MASLQFYNLWIFACMQSLFTFSDAVHITHYREDAEVDVRLSLFDFVNVLINW